MSSSGMSPTSPNRPRRPTIPGFLPSHKPKPIEQMTVLELRTLHSRNANALANPAPSTSAYVQRISKQQNAIEARLVELVGVDTIQDMLQRTKIKGEDDMSVDGDDEEAPAPSRAIETKRRVLARFSASIPRSHNNNASPLTFQEAVRIEQEAHAQDLKRKQEAEERKRRLGLPVHGEHLTREEREARIWAFMNHKPSESDMEDDTDEDDSDDDPATWFEDDQDDGRKGQNIVEPDYEDLSGIIRIDDSRISHNVFYEPPGDD